jgi:benzoyl-CoA reductase/2-hydroxyglutaryl-CoA dehydratase subunit BcrC/BadD/HgdB
MTNEAAKILQRLNDRDTAAFLRHTVTWIEQIVAELCEIDDTMHQLDMDVFALDADETIVILEQLAARLENSPTEGTDK